MVGLCPLFLILGIDNNAICPYNRSINKGELFTMEFKLEDLKDYERCEDSIKSINELIRTEQTVIDGLKSNKKSMGRTSAILGVLSVASVLLSTLVSPFYLSLLAILCVFTSISLKEMLRYGEELKLSQQKLIYLKEELAINSKARDKYIEDQVNKSRQSRTKIEQSVKTAQTIDLVQVPEM